MDEDEDGTPLGRMVRPMPQVVTVPASWSLPGHRPSDRDSPRSAAALAAPAPYEGSATFDIDRVTIGAWSRRRIAPGDLSCSIDAHAREMAWELIESPYRCKIGFPFASVASVDLHINLEAIATCTIQLTKPPTFYLQSATSDGGRSPWAGIKRGRCGQDELGRGLGKRGQGLGKRGRGVGEREVGACGGVGWGLRGHAACGGGAARLRTFSVPR